jgi:hypothetical protein
MEGVLLPLRGIRLKSFGNLNKPEGDRQVTFLAILQCSSRLRIDVL